MNKLAVLAIAGLFMASKCKKEPGPNPNPNPVPKVFTLTSATMTEGGMMPYGYTCDTNAQVFPPMAWTNPPAGTNYYALILENQDVDKVGAPGNKFCHWNLYNILGSTTGFDQGINLSYNLPDDSTLIGANDFGGFQWGGPCPPPNVTQNLKFTLYALSARVSLPVGSSKTAVLNAIKNTTLGTAVLNVKYKRR